MADRDRYSSDDNRDRLGQRDVYMDNRTGVGGSTGGYRAEWGRGQGEDRGRFGDREQNYNQRRAENASFGEADHGGGHTGYRGRDDETRYGGYYGAGGYYGRGGRSPGQDENDGGGRYRQSGSRYSAGDHQDRNWMSYPARSNPEFYADENSSSGAGWTEDFNRRDRSLESYRGQNRDDYRERGRTHYRGGEDRGFWDRAADKVAEWFGGDDSQAGAYGARQSHRGKGPKNYRRSDDRVREDVSDKLSDDHWLDASEIEVTAASGEVTLTGTVKSRDDKRRAEQLAEQVSGVDNVQNNLRVQPQQTGASAYGQAAGTMGATNTTIPPTTTGLGSDATGRTGKTTQ